MKLHLVPHQLAILAATAAFGVAWLAGLAADVPVDAIAWRAILAAGAFWLLGLLAGRMVLDAIIDAMGEQHERTESRARTDAKPTDKPAPRR